MDSRDLDAETGDEGVKTVWGEPSPGQVYAARARDALRRAASSGLLAGLGGSVFLVRGLQALRRGDRERGIGRLILGAVLVAIGALQRESTTRPSGERIEIGHPEAEVGEPEGAVEEAPPAERAAEAPEEEVEEAEEAEELEEAPAEELEEAQEVEEAAEEAPEAVAPERLGEAAFDEYSSEVPVPQKALNMRLLSLGSEVVWGVRDGDDAVVLSENYDAIVDREGVTYVGSSELDGERMLTVPDRVRDHWDEVSGGPTAVVSGTELVFATDDDLRADDLLLLVPEQWVDDLLGSGAE